MFNTQRMKYCKTFFFHLFRKNVKFLCLLAWFYLTLCGYLDYNISLNVLFGQGGNDLNLHGWTAKKTDMWFGSSIGVSKYGDSNIVVS